MLGCERIGKGIEENYYWGRKGNERKKEGKGEK
jgi:hypothetical protein